MADKLTPAKRSWNMSRIHGKDTKIETLVRKRLFRDGYRFRKNDSSLPGKPDIVLPKYHTAIFIHGCYWHHHGCSESHIPKSNSEFWMNKFQKNKANDERHLHELECLGWNVITIWECEIEKQFEETISYIEESLFSTMIEEIDFLED